LSPHPAATIQGKMPVCTEHGEGFVTHSTDAKNPDLATASTARSYDIHRADLPLSCPTPEQKLWNAHPRVYLPIEETGEATCPYCSAHYRLVD
jgi:uncharacterized Zn-finger protein